MGIMQVIRRTDGNIIHLVLSFAAELIQVPVETLCFHEKIGIREKRVNDTDAVERVHCCYEVVPGIFDGLHVPWGDEACCTNQSKVLGHWMLVISH
jgi:hypothetical protein